MGTSSKIPAVEVAVRTDPGRDPDKQVNEDSSVLKETSLGLLAVVCDGMGGHAGGKEASELAVQTILEIVEAAPPATSASTALQRAIEEANARIWAMKTTEAGHRPGSTVVAVLVHEGGAEVAHVGDSRLYLVHAGAISQVTRDHSMVQEMVARNLIRAEDAARHPDANKILRALGIAKEVEVELRPEPLPYVAGDVFVLCSDGLSDLVEPAEILQIAGAQPPAQAAGQLVDLANARGGHDNITAMVLRLKSGATVRDAATLLKTIPLTAHPVLPEAGPTGTVVSGPMVAPAGGAAPATATHEVSPLGGGAPVSVPNAIIPPAPSPARSSFGEERPRTPVLVLGIALAVIAVALVGAIVYIATRSTRHQPVPLVDDRVQDASSDIDQQDDTGAELAVVPAPTLSVEPTGKVRRDGGPPDPCGAAQRARQRDASAPVIEALDARCRQNDSAP